jgi:hypothetical protein
MAMANDACLLQAMVSFHTNDEDKDDDTHVTVTVRQVDSTLAAHIDDDFGRFDDHSDDGPFGLLIVNPATKNELRTGNVTVRIDPNGNDTWRFNFALDLLFSDGSHLTAQADGLELSEDQQQESFGIA